MNIYSEKEIWDSLSFEKKIITKEGLNYIVDKNDDIICFIYNENNLFILSDEMHVLWLTPEISFEKVEYSDSLILSFLKNNGFTCKEDKNGYILVDAFLK